MKIIRNVYESSLKPAVRSGFHFRLPGSQIGDSGLNFGLAGKQFRLPCVALEICILPLSSVQR
jgi:hypothetical protein